MTVLTTARLRLEPVSDVHFDGMHAMNRDPEVMRTHGYHWFDKAFQVHEPPASPIRREVLLYLGDEA